MLTYSGFGAYTKGRIKYKDNKRKHMKIIEALKKVKDLRRKADDLKEKIKTHCADLDCETPVYAPDQRAKVSEWLQAHGDLIKEILSLRVRIQRTNLDTPVTIEIGDVHVTKSIAEWIHRRKDLAKLEEDCWRSLTDRGLRESNTFQLTPTSPVQPVKRRLYFDPSLRDTKVNTYRSEPSQIDSTLEVINAVTTLKD